MSTSVEGFLDQDTKPELPARMFDLSGRIAMVTGSSRGIGFAIARALGGAGAHVILNGRDGAMLAQRLRQLRQWGIEAEIAEFDVTDGMASALALKAAAVRHGRLDILVSNAGGIVRKPLLEQSDEDWISVIDAHLNGGYRLAREAARIMVQASYGRIIFTSSVAGQLARPTVTGYVAAKHGINGLVRALAVELAHNGVTVNAIAPGYFPTDGNKGLREQDHGMTARIADRTPMGRWGELDELGAAAVYLASGSSGYVTGHVLTVDGGLTASL